MKLWLALAILWVVHVAYTEVSTYRATKAAIDKRASAVIWTKFKADINRILRQ